jgi:hypothetical protein
MGVFLVASALAGVETPPVLPLDCDPHTHADRLVAHAVAHASALGLAMGSAGVFAGGMNANPPKVLLYDEDGGYMSALSMNGDCTLLDATASGETLSGRTIVAVTAPAPPNAATALSAACSLDLASHASGFLVGYPTPRGWEVRLAHSTPDGVLSSAMARFDHELRVLGVREGSEPWTPPESAMARLALSCRPAERGAPAPRPR